MKVNTFVKSFKIVFGGVALANAKVVTIVVTNGYFEGW